MLRCKNLLKLTSNHLFSSLVPNLLKTEEEGVELQKKMDTETVERKDQKGGVSERACDLKTIQKEKLAIAHPSYLHVVDVVDYFNHRFPPLGREGLERLV